MATLNYTTKGVRFFKSTAVFTIEGGCKKEIFSAGKIAGKKAVRQLTSTSYLPFYKFKLAFMSKYAPYFEDMSEEDKAKIFKKVEEKFFAWMFAARKEKRTSKEYKRMKFFEFAKNELYSHFYGFGLLTEEFLPGTLPPFAEEYGLATPEPGFSWMIEQQSPVVMPSSGIVAYWQPLTSGVPIPEFEETLNLIAIQQEFIDEILQSQPLPDSEF